MAIPNCRSRTGTKNTGCGSNDGTTLSKNKTADRRVLEIMPRPRDPERQCPWDRKQSFRDNRSLGRAKGVSHRHIVRQPAAAYKARLLTDATAAIPELGYSGLQGEHMVAVENTPAVHNMVVCTLCSRYPWPVLGLPPAWYKSARYRSRSVIDPRGVLRELGLEVSDDTEVRVWDSTAEVRYLVLPERPAGTEAMTEEQLSALVTRDSMIGVARVPAP